MKQLWIAAAVAACLGMAGTALAQADVIAQRRAGLKRMNDHMTAMKVIADARGNPTPALAQVDDMIAFYRTLPSLFPAGSGTGDTKARPEIWTDNATFQKLAADILPALANLRTAAAAGDGAAFAEAYRAVGPNCGNCHRPFRAR